LSLYEPLLLITNIITVFSHYEQLPAECLVHSQKKKFTYDNNMQQNWIRKEP